MWSCRCAGWQVLRTCWASTTGRWLMRSLSRTIDMLETAMEAVVADGARIIIQTFMMGIFAVLLSKLMPPFESHYVYMFST
eukprot:3936093-Pleurochrysis_carterae.AAC.2